MTERKSFSKVKYMYFQQKYSKIMIIVLSRYIVTEIKLFLENLVLKGMSFIIYKLINFGWHFSEWCEILRHFKVISAKVLSPWGNKNCYY